MINKPLMIAAPCDFTVLLAKKALRIRGGGFTIKEERDCSAVASQTVPFNLVVCNPRTPCCFQADWRCAFPESTVVATMSPSRKFKLRYQKRQRRLGYISVISELDAGGERAFRPKGLSMRQIDRIIVASEDPNLTSSEKGVFTRLIRHADAKNGVVGADDSGRSLAEARNIAAALGYGESTVHKAFSALEQAGYIVWERAPAAERVRNRGLTGTIRIILPSMAS